MTTNPPGNGDRLDRIERLLERSIAASDERFERIEALVADNAQQIQTTMLAVDRLAEVQLQLAQLFEQNRQEFRQFQQRTDATLASINAALERFDRVLDYLMRRDGDRPTEEE